MALEDVPAPEARGECRIRVRMAGICGTDLELLKGYADFRGVPGHEFVGVVEAVGSPADGSWIGKRVAGEINIGCRRCNWCKAGVREHCVNRTVLGIRGRSGAFGELISLPADNLHEIPDTMADETAVFVEPTAAACRILEQVPIDDRCRVAVVGDGRMGLLVAQVLRTATPDVTIVGRHDHKLAVARGLGLVARQANGATLGDRFDVVVDVTGRPDGFGHALDLTRPRGTLVLKSTIHGDVAVASTPVVVNEVTIVGSRCGPFAPAIRLLASGAVRVGPLVSRIATLDLYESAFADARSVLKVLFDLRQ
jgi:threonine dehydrogenase-like Zn-dependent dehydrogenase